jgi:hypothetical protein
MDAPEKRQRKRNCTNNIVYTPPMQNKAFL